MRAQRSSRERPREDRHGLLPNSLRLEIMLAAPVFSHTGGKATVRRTSQGLEYSSDRVSFNLLLSRSSDGETMGYPSRRRLNKETGRDIQTVRQEPKPYPHI